MTVLYKMSICQGDIDKKNGSLYEAEAAGGKRAYKMIARSLLQSHDHKNLN